MALPEPAESTTRTDCISTSGEPGGMGVRRLRLASPDDPTATPNQHTEAELKLIRDTCRRNSQLGMIELWHRLRQHGYTRRPESLFRAMRVSTA